MPWIVGNIRWIMMVSGFLTSTMVYAALAPQAALQSTFGESLSGPVSEVVVRNWAALITMGGLMLFYGAFNPEVRGLVLTFTGAGKVIFIVLVLSQGGRFLGHQAGVAVAIDSVMVLLFVWYLVSFTRSSSGDRLAIVSSSSNNCESVPLIPVNSLCCV